MKKLSVKEQEEYDLIAKEVIYNKEYIKRKEFLHHDKETVYEHCQKVSLRAYRIALKRNVDVRKVVIGALLHDFYSNPWQENTKKKKFFEMHGFVHAKDALENSKKVYGDLIDPVVEDIIIKHMFPLNIKLPKYRETWIVTCADKIVSLSVIKHPSKWYRFIGIKYKKKK